MSLISVVLIVTNEENRIESCLRNLSWADEIVVVDGGSRDRTVEIAKLFTPNVFQREFDHFSNQKNYGVDQASGEWILSLDADERLTPELRDSILEVVRKETVWDGFYLMRTNFLFGRPLRFAGQRQEKILRLFRKGKGRFVQPIHEKVVLQEKVGELQGELIHESSPTVSEYLKKLRLYTDFEAQWMAEQGVTPTLFDLSLKPFLRFFYGYFLRLGFLDGYEGFLYHSLSSFYSFFKYVRLKEMNYDRVA